MKRYLPERTIKEIENQLFNRGNAVELKIEGGKISIIKIERKLVSKELPDRDTDEYIGATK